MTYKVKPIRLYRRDGTKPRAFPLTLFELPYVYLIPVGTDMGFHLQNDKGKNVYNMVTIAKEIEESTRVKGLWETRVNDTKRSMTNVRVRPRASELIDLPTYAGYMFFNKRNIDRWYMFVEDYRVLLKKIKQEKEKYLRWMR